MKQEKKLQKVLYYIFCEFFLPAQAETEWQSLKSPGLFPVF